MATNQPPLLPEPTGSAKLTIAIAGATGMIGSALDAAFSRAGHRVRRIGRGRSASVDIVWDVVTERLDPAALDGVDAVINLAGENIGQRWTSARRRAILESRVRSTSLLAKTMATRPSRPTVFISMSAVGIYGNRGDEILDETSTTGQDFYLSDVARAWESSADPARAAGVRVVHPRTGVVLSPDGGVLAKMLPVFRLGAGGRVGSGGQWMSWIALTDLVRAIEYLLHAPDMSGGINVTSPNPVTNAEFTSVLAEVLCRHAVATVPEVAIRMIFGEMGEETLLASHRVLPRALERAGFEFTLPRLEDALRAELA